MSSYLEICNKVCERLIDVYGFSEGKEEKIGRELYVEFHRGPHTISLAVEPGSLPIIELLYPASETGEKATPWAARDEVPYCRKVPRLRVDRDYKWNCDEDLKRFLTRSLDRLEELEADFLHRGAPKD